MPTPTINLPKTNDDQDLTLNLLIILGLILILISKWGSWFQDILQQISTPHNVDLNFNPFAQGSSTVKGVNQPASGGSNSLVGHYTVDLAGGGQMTVNASDPAAARANVIAEGGTPA